MGSVLLVLFLFPCGGNSELQKSNNNLDLARQGIWKIQSLESSQLPIFLNKAKKNHIYIMISSILKSIFYDTPPGYLMQLTPKYYFSFPRDFSKK